MCIRDSPSRRALPPVRRGRDHTAQHRPGLHGRAGRPDRRCVGGVRPMTEQIHVAAEKPYDVTVSRGCLAQLPELVGGRRTALVHASSRAGLAQAVAATLGESTLLVDVPDGERAKTAETLVSCWERLAAAGFTRSDVVVGLGGGSTTDLAGFVAASWLRGVRYISVPTTVLAMVDAAVGGKTGINLSAGKNLVGAFYEPSAVLCDLDLLTSLPAEGS